MFAGRTLLARYARAVRRYYFGSVKIVTKFRKIGKELWDWGSCETKIINSTAQWKTDLFFCECCV